MYDALYNHCEDNVEIKPKFKIGDCVRILKKTFEKGFTPNWSEELFIVNGVRLTVEVQNDITGKQWEQWENNRPITREQ